MDKENTTFKKFAGIIAVALFFSSCGAELRVEEGASSSSAEGSKTQQVSTDQNVCPSMYEPVCAQPPMPECPTGNFCAQVMPNPKTYSNNCEQKKDEASFISEGRCPDYTL